jgi:hypothetical protein
MEKIDEFLNLRDLSRIVYEYYRNSNPWLFQGMKGRIRSSLLGRRTKEKGRVREP